jgi:hypothetical protein
MEDKKSIKKILYKTHNRYKDKESKYGRKILKEDKKKSTIKDKTKAQFANPAPCTFEKLAGNNILFQTILPF